MSIKGTGTQSNISKGLLAIGLSVPSRNRKAAVLKVRDIT